MTILGEEIFQLAWRDHGVFVYDFDAEEIKHLNELEFVNEKLYGNIFHHADHRSGSSPKQAAAKPQARWTHFGI